MDRLLNEPGLSTEERMQIIHDLSEEEKQRLKAVIWADAFDETKTTVRAREMKVELLPNGYAETKEGRRELQETTQYIFDNIIRPVMENPPIRFEYVPESIVGRTAVHGRLVRQHPTDEIKEPE